MRSYIFKSTIILFLSFIVYTSNAQTAYKQKVEKYTSTWQKMIPRYSKIQFAGSIGLLSIGPGWNYGRNHWETDLLIGLVPRYADKRAKVTLTLKQNYIPWKLSLNEYFSIEPLTCGLYLNTLLDRNFWVSEPDKYPNGYYSFSTRIRSHIFIGERITFNLKSEKYRHKSITFFYELSTCDLYLISAIGNKYLRPRDYLSLSFGLKFQIL